MAFPDLDPNQVFRDFTTFGVPASGKWDPRKVEIRRLLKSYESAIIALIGGQGGDIDLVRGVIFFSVNGGTADDIIAEPDAELPENPRSTVYIIGGIAQDNTGPVTINGKALLTNSGNEIAAGGIVAGGIYVFLDDGTNFRLVSDQASAAVLAGAEDAAERAETAAAGVEYPVSYGLPQSLSTSQRLQAQANIGLQFRVTPQMFGAVGDGIYDDSAALIACIASGYPVDFGSHVYAHATPIVQTLSQAINWKSDGATLLYTGAIAKAQCELFVLPFEHVIDGMLKFDANLVAYSCFVIRNVPGSVGTYPAGHPDLIAPSLHATRAYRSGAAFTGGDGIYVSGGWGRVILTNAKVTDLLMAEDARVPGAQGIFGITCTRDSEGEPHAVDLSNIYVENIWCEDDEETGDQDAVRVFSDYPTMSPSEGSFRIGGTIRNCRGRSVKSQMQFGFISGLKCVKEASVIDPAALGILTTINSDIELQVGGGQISDVEFFYDGCCMNGLIRFTESIDANKATSFPNIDGIRAVMKGSQILERAIFLYGNNDVGKWRANVDNVLIEGNFNYFVSVRGGANAIGCFANLSNFVGAPLVAAIQGSIASAVKINVANFLNTGTLKPALSGTYGETKGVNIQGFNGISRGAKRLFLDGQSIEMAPSGQSLGTGMAMISVGASASSNCLVAFSGASGGSVFILAQPPANQWVAGTNADPGSGTYRLWMGPNNGLVISNNSGANREIIFDLL